MENQQYVEEVRDPAKSYIVWCWDDVQSLKPTWSEEKCQTVFDKINKQLRDRSIEAGWEIISILIDDE